MERMNFVKDGVLRLPPGFRFHPTDEELVVQYLKRKVLDNPLPASIIPVCDVCKSDPWDLPGDKKQERYFFSTKEAKYPNGNRSNRATYSGYWKATGKDKPILAGGSKTNTNSSMVVGMKKTLVFYQGKPPHGCRTDWVMHEYRLLTPQSPTPISSPLKNKLTLRGVGEGTGDWVLCRIFLKRRNNNSNHNNACNNKNNDEEEEGEEEVIVCEKNETRIIGNGTPVFYDFLGKDRDLNLPAPCSSSSGSSAVTEVSLNEDNNSNSNSNSNSHESSESSSCCNSFSTLRSQP